MLTAAPSILPCDVQGPLQIELLEQDYNTVGSFTAAALLTLMAIITLFLKSMLQWRLENQEKRAQQEEHHEH